MLTIEELPLNAIVSFDLYPSQFLGVGYRGAKVLAWLDADSAPFFGVDPVALHANVYPTLPGSTPNAYDGYPWVKLKLASGAITVIGVPFIKDDTLNIASTRKMRFTVEDVAPEIQEQVLLALSSIGLSAVNVEYID